MLLYSDLFNKRLLLLLLKSLADNQTIFEMAKQFSYAKKDKIANIYESRLKFDKTQLK